MTLGNPLPTPRPAEVRWAEPERVIAVLRVLVVISMALLVAFGTEVNRTYPRLAMSAIGIAAGYAAVVMLADLRGLRALPQDWVTALDSILTISLAAATGAAHSIVVAILPLAIVAAAVRQGLRRALVAAVGSGSLFALVAFSTPKPRVPLFERAQVALWWSAYLIAFGILTGTLRKLLDREHQNAVSAEAEALSEHLAIVEERDLRARLLDAQQQREEGLRVVLHEFRTPVSSMAALATSLARPGRFEAQERDRAITLMAAHAKHLTEMLDGLADVAVRTGDPRGVPHVRFASLDHLARAALHAAGVDEARVRVSVSPPGAKAMCDDHRLRRVLTNLLENAVRHGAGGPIELNMVSSASSLKIEVADRGPGLTVEQTTLVTRKFVRLSERAGTAGLGLWIVEQLVSAMHGTLVLEPRPGGGLVARVIVPLGRAMR